MAICRVSPYKAIGTTWYIRAVSLGTAAMASGGMVSGSRVTTMVPRWSAMIWRMESRSSSP